MDGDVTVSSVPGKSSTFTIKVPAIVTELEPFEPDILPALNFQSALVQGLEADEELAPLTGNSVLVIDDDPNQRALMRRFLTQEGFAIETASGGEEGLQMARRLLPVAITLDVMMPEMDGWMVLSAIKADPVLRDIPVIMLTMMDDKKRGYALGASNYLTKPIDRRHLTEILRNYGCANPPCPVLLVEDDATTRHMMRAMLEKAGWSVTEAEIGAVGLERVAENRPALILLDLMMPEKDGFDFAVGLHQHPGWRTIPIVVLTAKDLTADDLRRLDGNVHSVVDKRGCSREELMHQVRDQLAGIGKPASRVKV